MLRRFRPLTLAVALIASLTAAASSNEFDLRYLLAALGLFTIAALARYARARDLALLRFEDRVDGALWGPEDANGKRQVSAGIVAVVHRLAEDVRVSLSAAQDAAKQAAHAADQARQAAQHAEAAALAARAAQALILNQGQSNPITEPRAD